jgi:hypothetical protein
LQSDRTIDHKTYTNDCLKPLVHTLNEQKPLSGTKNMEFHH